MKRLLIFCLCFYTQAQSPITRNPFVLAKKKTSGKGTLLAKVCWHDLGHQACLVQHEGEIKIIAEKKPLQLGKAEGLGG